MPDFSGIVFMVFLQNDMRSQLMQIMAKFKKSHNKANHLPAFQAPGALKRAGYCCVMCR